MKNIKAYLSVKLIINILFFLSFFIYVKKTPLSTETQPVFIFLISTIFVFFINIKISKRDIFLVFHIVFLTFYFLYQIVVYKTGIMDYVTYLIGPFIYLVFVNRINNISALLLRRIIFFFSLLTIITLFKIPVFYDMLSVFSDL